MERARQRYSADYRGIALNALVSGFSSLTATGFLDVAGAVSRTSVPVVFVILFVFQVVPKLLVEFNKSYRVNKAKREGFSEGLLEDDFDETKTKLSFTDYVMGMFEHASYF